MYCKNLYPLSKSFKIGNVFFFKKKNCSLTMLGSFLSVVALSVVVPILPEGKHLENEGYSYSSWHYLIV